MGRDKLATPSAALARRIPELDNRCRARIKARELRRRIDNGEDPLADFEEARTAPTVTELDDRFKLEHLPRKRPGTRIAYKRTLNRHIRPHFGLHIRKWPMSTSPALMRSTEKSRRSADPMPRTARLRSYRRCSASRSVLKLRSANVCARNRCDGRDGGGGPDRG